MAAHVHGPNCGCAADAKQLAGALENLYPQIDTTRVWALNELTPGAGKNVFKPYDERSDTKRVLKSNPDDPQLIVHVPFTSEVKVRSFSVIATGSSRPVSCKLFVNRDDIDFGSAPDSKAFAQEINLSPDSDATIEYPTKAAKFQNVSSITLFFPAVESADETQMQINYIHFKGEATKNKRQAVTVVYEAVANPKDHKTPGAGNGVSKSIT